MKKSLFLFFIFTIITSLILIGCESEVPISNNQINLNDEKDMKNEGAEYKDLLDVVLVDEASNTYISEKLNITVKDLYVTEANISMAMEFIGQTYPNLEYKDIDGNLFSIYDIDTPIILKYGSGFCKACLDTEAVMNEFQEKNEGKYTLISLYGKPEKDEIDNILKVNPSSRIYHLANFDVLTTDEMYKNGTPFFIFIDENKVVKLIHPGGLGEDLLNRLTYLAFKADK